MSLVKTVLVLAAVAAAVTIILRVMPREGGRPAPRPAEEAAHYRHAITPPERLGPDMAAQEAPEAPAAASAPPATPRIGPAPPAADAAPPSKVSQPPEAVVPAATQPKAAVPAAAPGAATTIHRVGPGDSLYQLARKYYGDPSRWTLIRDANPALRDSGVKGLRLDSELVIPAAPASNR